MLMIWDMQRVASFTLKWVYTVIKMPEPMTVYIDDYSKKELKQ